MESRSSRQEVELLKHESDFLVADVRQLVVLHVADQVAVEIIQAAGGRIQTADQIHQRRFAGSGRTHDGHILAAPDFDVYARYRVDLLIAHHVRLPQIVGADDDSVALQHLAAIDEVLCCGCHALAFGRRLSNHSVVDLHFCEIA